MTKYNRISIIFMNLRDVRILKMYTFRGKYVVGFVSVCNLNQPFLLEIPVPSQDYNSGF